jgi:pimeloyl-ACP methyl ester carboxylesterase
VLFGVSLLAALAQAPAPSAARRWSAQGGVRVWRIRYRAHNGARRNAFVLVPRSYRSAGEPPIPLIISPHGRGLTGRTGLATWGDLPARGGFAVVSPDGQGRVLRGAYSWGAGGDISDLAKMPQVVSRELPWLHLDHRRIYAFGGSMGGQETLLLLARHPQLLAGAAAFDAVADFPLQYHDFARLRCDSACLKRWKHPIGRELQELARKEVGGTPRQAPYAWALRSPIAYGDRIAFSCVPLQLWWSAKDEIVIDQQRQSERLYNLIRRLNPTAPVSAYYGYWRHSREMRARTRLPLALANFGLLPDADTENLTSELHAEPAPWLWQPCKDGAGGTKHPPD